ncbi:uncharacterized protein [Panulirus ornatus]|uniref:uncharacterized protein isoform X2 n=1 Tax=Panulirus ornatus TaxID=150431 RepID=UPI003A85876D
MHPSETSDDAVWSTRSLEDMEAIAGEASGEISYEGVRLVPLSQQAALRSSGSLQLVVALSPGCEMVNSDHLRHVTKADLWRLWQDSERQLRARLRQAECQRDELLRQLSKIPQHEVPARQQGPKERWERRSLGELVGDTTEDVVELYDARKHTPHVADARATGGRRREERIEMQRQRLARLNRDRQVEEVRLKSMKGDVPGTPRKRKQRQRSRSQEHLEAKTNLDSLIEGRHYPRVEDRACQPKYTNRRKQGSSQDRRRGSDDIDVTPRHRAKSHRVVDTVIESTGPEDTITGYCSTPLPLLHSLHQQTKCDAERSFVPLQAMPLDTREERIPYESYSDQIQLQTFCGEVRGRGCDNNIRPEDSHDEGERHRKSDDDIPPRRRRGAHHPPSGHTEGQHRRPRERLSSREISESRRRRDSSQQRDPRHSATRRPYEREVRDLSGPYSGSHRQHGARRHTSHESSSEQEESRYASTTASETISGRETFGRRHPAQHSLPRSCERRRGPSDPEEERRSSERVFREVLEPP